LQDWFNRSTNWEGFVLREDLSSLVSWLNEQFVCEFEELESYFDEAQE
jgi:hypothetical protein